jgi:raffinose/stachyose/melibiose transport system substrate-binding protein
VVEEKEHPRRGVTMIARRLVALASSLTLVTGLAASTVAQSDGEGVELTIWVNQGDSEPIKNMLTRFDEESEHSLDIVTLPADGFEDALQTRWAGGERPDILEWHTGLWAVSALNASENLLDLSDEAFVADSGDLY